MNNKKTFWFIWGSVMAISVFTLGLLYLGFIDYGITVFCILPACIGLITGVMAKRTKAMLGAATALLTIILLLWAGGAEGIICIIMAIPVIGIFVLLGYIIANSIKQLTKKSDETKLTILPFIMLLIAAGIEVFWKGAAVSDQVTTVMELPYTDSIVYNHIKKVDTVTAEPSFLHELGLPYPKKCIMTAEQTGGLRICKFGQGEIVETIQNLKRNELLEMEVTEYNLPGKNWFSFNKDIYQIKKKVDATVISRTTFYTSNLKPRLYWKWIEQITIGAEQDLVFKNLRNELAAQSY